MTGTRNDARPASRWMGLFLTAAVGAAPGLAHARPADLFYERAAMVAVDAKCGLFAPDLGQALAAATAQARGAALRAGASQARLDELERSARALAENANCASPGVARAAQQVRSAFQGFAQLSRITYPGDVAAWHADRVGGPGSLWRLKQDTRFGADTMTFGLAGRDEAEALLAVAQFPDGATPYAARLVLRDVDRTPGPYLDRWSGGPTARLPLARRLPPPGALETFMAQARKPAGRDLLPPGARGGWAFRFPPAAAKALAALDPREAVAVDFLFPTGGVRRAYVEVGDFAAGAAFVQMAAR